ncbi:MULTISPECIES: AMP-binding protein [Chryseobacterium]|uniref:Acyl-coenzyme A synthetase/AMP-(Fatty) acid ligase n=2 Tax=Chryseobacterium TaxID=59732 RepID=A0ABU0TIL1_9FLAO|nr:MULTISPECIES: AMP-binding protein [Chryseobacterium]MDQ1096661.1 acyl-coenzyme A synthetase/AMP-(fatty) acid ligase [Chryseobacterium camelliae]MDR6087943.1 acyl-coenzyme A synthetase/AMP-(fatty) acid ligase [Chryseobacterium sp. SORGH_AS_0909]MDR6132317.1 acyl-coenzyme A synthetase/AMP-(fatty) acid ligase [Chryseobacterium sp. SORGH_AS_1175]MDT3409474.1 acyl-coenzyme A synthetase/AMP-(fatty) acid ligase [Pseudacidovorax intermedius]
MKILENIIANKNLLFTEASTGRTIPVGMLYRSLGLNPVEKGLLFLYNDNQLNSIEILLNFYGTAHTIALLGRKLHPDFKDRLEAEYRPKYIFDPQRNEIPGYSLKEFSDTIKIFMMDDYQNEIKINSEIKILLSTSGTTGTPKLVKLSDESLYQNALSILDYMPILESDVVPLNVPINFVYGFSIFTTNCMRAARIVCSDKDIMQNEFWKEMDEYGYSTLGGVPYLYENLNRIGFFRKNSSSLRYLTHTGGTINTELRKIIFAYCEEYSKEFFAQYGQTEAGGRMAYLSTQGLMNEETSIGSPVKNGNFTIDEETGELLFSHPSIFGGYANTLEDLADYHQKKVLHTGDTARKDEDGIYYITGRIKRIMKLFGIRLNLDEVEFILKNELQGTTFACLNDKDKKIVVMYDHKETDPQIIKETIKNKLHINPQYVQTEYIESFPLSPNGKINYPLLQNLQHENP